MTSREEEYFLYLRQRGSAGLLYRKWWLYPRLTACVRGRVLDVGCGIGDFLRYRRGTEGVDVNPHAVAWCREAGLMARPMAPDCLPFGNGEFDAVLLDNVLEHLERPAPLLADIRRVLKASGILLAGVPGRKGYASDPDHKVFYDEAALVRLLDRNGFDCERVFHMPVRCPGMQAWLRQYCIYGVFRARPA
jgi:SAM-dependent methyltransferase